MKTQTHYTCAEGTTLVYAHPDGIKNEADIIRCIRSGDVPVAVLPELLYELEIASKTSMKERIRNLIGDVQAALNTLEDAVEELDA